MRAAPEFVQGDLPVDAEAGPRVACGCEHAGQVGEEHHAAGGLTGVEVCATEDLVGVVAQRVRPSGIAAMAALILLQSKPEGRSPAISSRA